jgi:putative hemolysin
VLAWALVLILLLLVANGIFAMSEIAVVAARRGRLQQRADAGDRRAARALQLKHDPTSFLSTVQVGITVVSLLAGAYSGATFAEPLAAWLAIWPWLAPYSAGIALAVVVGVMTYFALIIGELVPKAIALRDPERIAGLVTAPVAAVARLATPVVWLLSGSTNLLLAILRMRGRPEPQVTEQEIRALIKQATQAGDIAPVERQIVEQVFRLGDRRVAAIMTPRHEIDWLDAHHGIDGLRAHLVEAKHPRVLVCDGDLDRVLGVGHAEELLAELLARQAIDLRAHLKPPLFVPSTLSVFRLLETFRSSHIHVALVLDEFGAIEGLVTPTDILEGLVGEIPSAPSSEPGPILQREDGSWLVDGAAPVDDVAAAVGLPPVPPQEQGTYDTLAGLVMTRLARVPRTGDRFTWGGFRFEVVDMDGRRVDKVLIEAFARRGHDDRHG